MPLKNYDASQIWPPEEVQREHEKFREWDAWYSGDPERLANAYAAMIPGVNSSAWSRFWSRIGARQPSGQKAKFHVPVASDLSSLSASLLFSVPPTIRIAEAHQERSQSGRSPRGMPAATRTEKRIEEIWADSGSLSILIEAAESASAMGGAYLHPAWDKEVAPFPFPNVVQADAAVPSFRYNKLISVIFHREVFRANDETVYRHLELHERVPGGNAHILHALYRGTDRVLGQRQSDSSLMEYTGLVPEVPLPFEEIDVEYTPNIRPNRLWRGSALGLSDYSGSEILLDGLDEVYAAWMRDIRLAKARIIVPKDMIDEMGAFDVDREVFTPVEMVPSLSGENQIIAQQFKIRNEEYLATALEFIERAVSNAGYSPQTYGLKPMVRADTAAALRVRENRTTMTMERKGSWWTPALSRLWTHIGVLDAEVFGSGITPMPVLVSMSDQAVRDPVELAQTVNVLRQAQSASTQERVKMLHPEWSPEEVDAEVQRISDDTPAPTITATPGAPMPADGTTPPVTANDQGQQ